jgi:hypothetical protein
MLNEVIRCKCLITYLTVNTSSYDGIVAMRGIRTRGTWIIVLDAAGEDRGERGTGEGLFVGVLLRGELKGVFF